MITLCEIMGFGLDKQLRAVIPEFSSGKYPVSYSFMHRDTGHFVSQNSGMTIIG